MLNSITIKNFKAIQSEKGLTLNNLASVNYLVGKNGCGKSSVLEMLTLLKYYKQENIIREQKEVYVDVFLTMPEQWEFDNRVLTEDNGYLDFSSSDMYYPGKEGTILNISLSRNITLANNYGDFVDVNVNYENKKENNEFLYDLISKDTKWKDNYNFKQIIPKYIDLSLKNIPMSTTYNLTSYYFKIYKTLIKKFIPEFETAPELSHIIIDDETYDFELLSSGQQKILSLINQIFQIKFWQTKTLILIDEPESNLHPEFQKKISAVLQEFVQLVIDPYHQVQFIISTHSPFIISEASKYKDTQKVYLIKDGQTRGLEENSLGQGQDGFVGYEMKEIANKILGVEQSDFNFEKYIICEGEPTKLNRDSVIYNNIFQPKENVKFISVGNCSLVKSKARAKVSDVFELIFNSEIEIFGFFDKDTSDAKKIIDDLTTKNIKCKFTTLTEMESYLYHPDVITIYNQKYKKNITVISINIIEDQNDKHRNMYFNKFVKSSINGLSKSEFEVSILSKTIREMGNEDQSSNNVYWQLHNLIFT